MLKKLWLFLVPLICGPDDRASMSRIMAWAVFLLIIISWCIFPERPITELIAFFGVLLGYGLGGKVSYNSSTKTVSTETFKTDPSTEMAKTPSK